MTRFAVSVFVATFCFAAVAAPPLIAADDVAPKAKSLQTLIYELQSNDAKLRKATAEHVQSDYEFIFDSSYHSYTDNSLQTKISLLRREARPHTAAILKLLKSPHTETRAAAALLLAASGPGIKGARQGLLEIIHNEKPNESWGWALFCLPYVCEPQEPVGPDLLKSYEKYTAEIRKSNADSYPKANGNAVVTGGSDQSNKPSEEEIFWSCAANGAHMLTLILIKTDRVDTELPTLLEATREKYSREIRALALITLANLQSESDAALPKLRRLLQDKDIGLRTAAANAIVLIEGDTRSLNNVCLALKLSEAETAKFRKQAEEHFSQQQLNRGPRTLEDFAWTLRFSFPALKYGNSVQRRMAYRYLWSQRPDLLRETLRLVASLPRWICESCKDCFEFDGAEANHQVLHENYRIPGATPLR